MEKVILKWRNSDGRCTHKKNNHRHNGGLSDCIYKYCPYFEECKLVEEEETKTPKSL